MTAQERADFREAVPEGAVMAAEEDLLVTFSPERLAELVEADEVRKGVTGYWLPHPPDPGFKLVVRRLLR